MKVEEEDEVCQFRRVQSVIDMQLIEIAGVNLVWWKMQNLLKSVPPVSKRTQLSGAQEQHKIEQSVWCRFSKMRKGGLSSFHDMKIASRWKKNKPEPIPEICKTPKLKGLNELEGLIFDIKLKSQSEQN